MQSIIIIIIGFISAQNSYIKAFSYTQVLFMIWRWTQNVIFVLCFQLLQLLLADGVIIDLFKYTVFS